jgi:hypothetical protein
MSARVALILAVLSCAAALHAQDMPRPAVEPGIQSAGKHELMANGILEGRKQPDRAVALDTDATGIRRDGAWFVKTDRWIARPGHEVVWTSPGAVAPDVPGFDLHVVSPDGAPGADTPIQPRSEHA